MSKSTNEKCISPDDVQITLKSVFEFIKQNQISPLGFLSETTILLKISLTNIQLPFIEDRQSASNTVTGLITEVTDTYVVLVAKSGCEEIYSEYTVEYNKIIYVENYRIYNNFDKFEKYINKKIPKLCYDKHNEYLQMIESLKAALIKYKDDKTINFRLIFDGVNSRRIQNTGLDVIRNLVVFGKTFIFPITTIGGYIIAPICNNTKETIQIKTAEEEDKEKGGVLNV